jgi:hypothetical protein
VTGEQWPPPVTPNDVYRDVVINERERGRKFTVGVVRSIFARLLRAPGDDRVTLGRVVLDAFDQCAGQGQELPVSRHAVTRFDCVRTVEHGDSGSGSVHFAARDSEVSGRRAHGAAQPVNELGWHGVSAVKQRVPNGRLIDGTAARARPVFGRDEVRVDLTDPRMSNYAASDHIDAAPRFVEAHAAPNTRRSAHAKRAWALASRIDVGGQESQQVGRRLALRGRHRFGYGS